MRNKATEKLLALAAQHPELPIEALVDCEVVASDDFNTWWGDVFDVSIEELWRYPNEDGKTWTKDEALEDVFDFADYCSEYLGDRHDDFEQMWNMDDEEAERVFKNGLTKFPGRNALSCTWVRQTACRKENENSWISRS